MIAYIDRDILRVFFLALLTMLAFVQIGYFVSVILEMAGSGHVFGSEDSKLGWVLLYYVATVPRQAAFTIPVGTAMGVLWVYMIKARQNEILAYLVGGVSPFRIAAPLIGVGAVLSVAGYLTAEFLANPGDQWANRIERINIKEQGAEALTRERNVFQKGLDRRFYDIRNFDPFEEIMELPIIFDMRENWNSPNWRLDARFAERIVPVSAALPEMDTIEAIALDDDSVAQTEPVELEQGEAQWVFYDAVFRQWDEEGELITYRRADELRESDLDVELEAELTRYLRQRFRPSQMGTRELLDYIGLFRLQGKPTYELRSYLHFNFAIPLGALVMAVLMCGHILRPSATGVLVGFGGGLVLIASYYFVLLTARQMAIQGAFHPVLAAWFPTVLFLAIGLYMLNKYRPA